MDKILIKRGTKEKLEKSSPLSQGELFLARDEERLYVGGPRGNIPISTQKEVDEITEQLAQKAPLKNKIDWVNLLHSSYNVKGDGVTDDTVNIQAVLNEAASQGLGVYIPARTYIISTGRYRGESTDWWGLKIPENSTLYIEKGAVFKLVDDAPPTSRVVTFENNISIFGHLTVDGSADTITNGNEHMAGVFMYGCKNIYIENINSYNCYGDNVQISGDRENLTENIVIDVVRCRKAGRKNLVLEGVNNLHIRTAILDNLEGNSKDWQGGGCLDVEPWEVKGLSLHNRIDYLETTGSNDFTAGSGMTEEEANSCTLDIGTLVQKSGKFLLYAITINIDNAYFSEDCIIDMMYAGNLKIGKAFFKKPNNRVISTQHAQGHTPKLYIDNLYIDGNPEVTPSSPAIYWRGSSIYIGRMKIVNYNNRIVHSQYTGYDGSDFHINQLISENSGEIDGSLIYLDYYTSRGSMSIDHLIVKDSREVKPKAIIEYSDAEAMHDFKLTKLHNPDNIAIYTTRYGNFRSFFKLAGFDNDVSIIMCNGNPEGQIALPVGSIALRLDGSNGSTLYVKESGGSTSTGWVAK